MVTVTKTNEVWNRVCVQCPICGTLINRIKGHWTYHMENTHSASSSTWSDSVDVFGGEQDGLTDRESPRTHFAYRCYGCGDSFTTKALLVTHLSSVHSAT